MLGSTDQTGVERRIAVGREGMVLGRQLSCLAVEGGRSILCHIVASQ